MTALRITPADAGKTVLRKVKKLVRTGSPPRMRGKLSEVCMKVVYIRITPADAGKTFVNSFILPISYGSPPRMRGKQKFPALPRNVFGITPADAGKTGTVGVSAVGMEDHPRGCGENDESAVLDAINTGSPPRMRGKPLPARLSRRWYRITPADAGKTAPRPAGRPCRRDHPRGCGENQR